MFNDWTGVSDPWDGVTVDLVAMQRILCQFFHIATDQCGPAIAIGEREASYARVYSFQLPTRSVVARLVAPVRPLFKTENEVAAMDFVRRNTSLPVPIVYVYCSVASNPVGAEWLIMEHMRGVELAGVWDRLKHSQKRTLARNLADFYSQLSRLKADGCGGIYYSVDAVDDSNLTSRTPRWIGAPLPRESLLLLKSHCNHHVGSTYKLGPIHDLSFLNYGIVMPTPSQTMPVFSSEQYIRLVGYNGNPPTRNERDSIERQKCVDLFQSIRSLYPDSSLFGPLDTDCFRFSHGDLHESNILVNPNSGEVTAYIDWETGAFRPSWATVHGVGWFNEDKERHPIDGDDPGNFQNDIEPGDGLLRAFFRSQLGSKNFTLFSFFHGGVELRAVLRAASNDPIPSSNTAPFLVKYFLLGCWNESRRGSFPWDVNAWRHMLIDLDEVSTSNLSSVFSADLKVTGARKNREAAHFRLRVLFLLVRI
ncbi:hypothetical protein D9757_008726 [Collybiopsis confluens]|uniref:Aminoglycoside phosphotransferase domain-containing protein n=1 Tax=Collybiopsis confluens TaxID=2823264 RepID=A0A8H5M328_9AGAR|nr:hypothetical protein D9757_008726 [Collybiopsis confluens]